MRTAVGYIALGIIVGLGIIGFLASLWDAVVNKDRTGSITLAVLVVLVIAAWWGLGYQW